MTSKIEAAARQLQAAAGVREIWGEILVNVKTFGAKGDGVTDDTGAFQAALDYAATHGGIVYFQGVYKVTAPLQVKWTSMPGPSMYPRPIIGGIQGVGSQSVIRGYNIPANRAVLELLGEGNTYAVWMEIAEFRIVMDGSCHINSFALRMGDARNFKARRIECAGANGLMLKVASSATYAQIGTVFEQCVFQSNYGNIWFPNDDLATQMAVKVESSGAYWDNVRFESCILIGLVETRAWILEFDNCQFSTNPKRPSDGSFNYAYNINTTIGNLTCRNCYFEDHHTAIFIGNGVGHVQAVTIEDCHFTGVTNYAVNGTYGVRVYDQNGVNKIGVVTVARCKFGGGTNAYNDSIVRNDSTSAKVIVDNPVNLNDPSQALTTKGIITGKNREWVKFAGKITAVSAASFATLKGFNSASYYYIDQPCWISRVKYVQNAKTSAGNQSIGVYKNASTTIFFETFPTSTLFTNKSTEASMDQGTVYNPNQSTRILNKGDKINVRINTDATFAPLNTDYEVWVELTY